MDFDDVSLVIWDVDGTMIPADLRWLRRAIARTYELTENAVTFPGKKVHGYTDESIVVDTAIASGVPPAEAEAGISRFGEKLAGVMDEGREELRRVQPPYPGVAASIAELHQAGFVQTVLTGNLRSAAEIKLVELGLATHLDLHIGGYGSDDRDRFNLPAVVAQRFERVYGHRLRPSRALIIGDAPNDIACARHAGFRVVVVTHRASRDELTPYDPDAIVDHFDSQTIVSTVRSMLGDKQNGSND
ncbi:HAD family hydrolase [Actinoplanes sp. GCM10030250]|uniref:HAD family hydrolase n=1 Tax=Actinoplanes sp. GCM10030250 TaxID=3273376 RepID=UPI00360AD8F5